ncbi:hypothetical protein C8Q76DRAFT_702871, partial [Earliella scabrosa]
PQTQAVKPDVTLQPPNISQSCGQPGDSNRVADGLLERLKVPTVVLETPSMSPAIAGALSLSLLGHTLFVKNQIPFPVAQLTRMPAGKANPKAAKKREQLITTFDTLDSHLRTTFDAISTAYAKCKSGHTANSSPSDNHQIESASSGPAPAGKGTAHLMFVLGSSVAAARARILLTIDGIDVKMWGSRTQDQSDDEDVSGSDEESDCESSGEEESQCESGEEGSEESDDEDTGEDEDDEDRLSDSTDSDEGLSGGESSDSDSGPPLSRTPSPDLPVTRSLAPSPDPLPSAQVPSTPPGAPPMPFMFVPPPPPPLSTITSTITNAMSPRIIEANRPSPPCYSKPNVKSPFTMELSTPQPPRKPAVKQSSASREVTPAPQLTHVEEQQALRSAQRLLFRTRMNAWVNGDDAIAPTQTHIYLRAPRRFAHPAWAAQQNLTRTLDGMLKFFLEDAGAVTATPGTKAKPRSRGTRTEGTWIGCTGRSAFAARESIKRRSEDDIMRNDEGHRRQHKRGRGGRGDLRA